MGVQFHFLNVGDGDCTIIDFPERQYIQSGHLINNRIMMLDIHHHDDHDFYEHVIDYYKNHFKDINGNIKPIFRFVSTHPHKDHLKGIKKLFDDYHIQIINFWDLDHEFEPVKEGADWDEYKEDWEKYCELRKMKDTDGLCVRRYWDHDNDILYWNEDRIHILSPSKKLYESAHKKEDGTKRNPEEVELNNMPYVLLIRVNDIKVLLASDAENKCWEYILANHKDKITQVDLMKAAHHGHESGFREEAIKILNPKKIIFSASYDSDIQYGAEKKYKEVLPNTQIYKTWELGNIIFDCDFNGGITLL